MNDKLIVALDYATEQDAMALVNQRLRSGWYLCWIRKLGYRSGMT